jgi:Arc/MetJ family transcription regulator
MRLALIGFFGLAALALGLDKVKNEHRMTEMYERQAVALEALASRPALQMLDCPGRDTAVCLAIHKALHSGDTAQILVPSHHAIDRQPAGEMARRKEALGSSGTDNTDFADCIMAVPKERRITVEDMDRCSGLSGHSAAVAKLPPCRDGLHLGAPVRSTDEQLGCRQ